VEAARIDTAFGLFFGLEADDRINAELEDDVDWRYILVHEPGLLSVKLSVDNPNMMGFWYVRDELGRVLETRRLEPGENFYEAVDIPVERGRYYFHLEAMKGSSIYTVLASFRPRIGDDSLRGPDPVKVVQVKKPKPKRRRGKKVVKQDTARPIADKLDVSGTLVLATPVNKSGDESRIFDIRFRFPPQQAQEMQRMTEVSKGVKVNILTSSGLDEKLLDKIQITFNTCDGNKCLGRLTSLTPLSQQQLFNTRLTLRIIRLK